VGLFALAPPVVGHSVMLGEPAGTLKYVALEPESMKLSAKVVPSNIVVMYPVSATGMTVSVPDPLFDSVSMPKINDPVTVAAPVEATEGNVMMVPLLSVANSVTGF